VPAIVIKQFDGMYPVVNSRLLKENGAQLAKNAKITGGSLKPFKAGTTVIAKRLTGAPKSIYRFGQATGNDTQHWFEFAVDADVVRGPIAGDTVERTYYTQTGLEPRITTSAIATSPTELMPAAFYRLGVPPPIVAPTLAVTGEAPAGEENETRYYVYTFVSAVGEEGPPSPPTETVTKPSMTVTLSGMATSPTGQYNINRKRIYRTNTGSNATDFQFVAEIAAATTTYADSKQRSELGEIMPSENWYPPRSAVHNEPGASAFNSLVVDPSPYTLSGLTMMANGIMAGFAGNIICFSEPYQPHAWPRDYELTTDFPVVATKAFGQSLAVLTQAYPYVINGVSADSMTMTRLDVLQACVSKRSAVAMANGVVYASPDGLVQVSAGGAQIITAALFTKDEWQAYKPESIHAYQHDGRYFAFYDTGSVQGCLVFSFNGQEPALVTLDQAATAGYQEPLTDTLYLAVGGNIVRWDAGSALTHTWRSKLYTLPKPMSFAVGQVIARAYPVSLTILSDSVSHAVTVANAQPFRLPAGRQYTDVEFTISGTVEVEQVLLATSMDDLKQL
jgi:hypothetical protein